VNARPRGKLRLDDLDTTNPIAVGDRVLVEQEDADWLITGVRPRFNYVLRQSTHRRFQKQMLAANLDQALFIFTVEYPFTKLSYLDRFLVMCEAYHIPAVIIFNKADLAQQQDKLWFKLADFRAIYEEAGYPTYAMNGLNPDNHARMTDILKGKRTFLAGVSGAGKSTLVNLADPNLDLRTGGLAQDDKGSHTTTFAEMFSLRFGGEVIDAPGFREFGVVGITREELSHYYPEMRDRISACRFNNCLHLNEPGCAVRAAVADGSIASSRYNTYQGILEQIPKANYLVT